MHDKIKIDKVIIDIINQIYEIEKKVCQIKEQNSIQRNINKLKEIFQYDLIKTDGQEHGFMYHNPIGESFNETRTDCEASIAGSGTDNLFISEVIKPIIRYSIGGINVIVQKAVVIVESKKSDL